MSFILLLTFSTLGIYNGPKTFSITEFQSKTACEVALKEAKKFYRTVNDESKCISVEKELEREKLKRKQQELKKELDNE